MSENSYKDIFTEYDKSIFSDGSIDPMGLRIIWTSLGNKIFKNKLNTISNDIRYYTLNLFHHYVICQCEVQFEDKIINLISRPPYNNRHDLHDGIIIFLESLLAHAAVKGNIEDDQNSNSSVLATYKLKGLMYNKPNDKRVNYLFVDRKEGILVRHILLGIHGRYKGPFQQIGIFYKNNYYQNTKFWKEEAPFLFANAPWNTLANDLIKIIDSKILSAKNYSATPIKIRVNDILSKGITNKYMQALKSANFKEKKFINFWKKQLGLMEGAAYLLYRELIDAEDKDNYELIIKKSSNKGSTDDNKYLTAICKIEPFITCIDKAINRLLKRGTIQIDNELKKFMSKWLNSKIINLSAINLYMNNTYLSQEALLRLKKLLEIYYASKDKNDPVLFIHKIIAFHKDIMDGRGNTAWISIGTNNSITQHSSFNYSEDYLKFLESYEWVNSYYLPTVKNLYEGLYNQ